MTTRRAGVRIAALLAGGAFALHQLRYLIGYGSESHAELGGQGHAYLAVLAPLVGVLLLLIAAEFGARLMGVRGRGPSDAAPRLRTLWAGASGCLLATYVVQETVEGALARSHPGGLAALAGHGGLVALPLAVALGLAIALLVKGGQRALELAAEPRVGVGRPPRLSALAAVTPPAWPTSRRPRRSPGARAPPVASIA